ncbi:complex I intermediate-associated protein 30, mitochondrial-like [Saccoglossus kowalevskii]|uniref:Complex I intermediate-associated protein 30, mitochondrial-like n=1 Tax=Saccoglossus kowalevskii TaxID=10224 RepID=A0ABM0H077_SACKO|nr:PREDICTED: complex I intermediate-associated protein 30, mitochondrial-like [Saccoglossus kowalevskii]
MLALRISSNSCIRRVLLNVAMKSTVIPCVHAASFSGGLSNIGHHLGMLAREMVDKAKCPNLDIMVNSSKKLWDFNDKGNLDKFVVATDKEMGGKSEAEFIMSKNNKALFCGHLTTEIPRDGVTEYSGYCTLKSKQLYKSFNRKLQMDLTPYNVVNMRVRGDGRSYMVNLLTESFFSNNKDDMWNYFLFTRGGPYWQELTIPFSKFFLTHRGRIQDRQASVDLERVNAIGLTMADAVDGDFALEIDYIGVSYDYTHTEEFAYEMYERNPQPKRR